MEDFGPYMSIYDQLQEHPPFHTSIDDLGLRELEQLRLVLRGDSAVDWRHLNFSTRAMVDDFLKLHLLNHDDLNDRALMRRLLREAVDYLRSTYHYRVADAVAEPFEPQDLFLYASGHHPRRSGLYQKIACILLKIVYVIHHMEGRELRSQSPIATATLSRMVDQRVMQAISDMKSYGLPIVEVSGSLKTPHSLITKVIAKQDTVSAPIYDRVRYRIITKEPDDVVLVLEYMLRTLFPFTLVVPSQTENSLINFEEMVEKSPQLRALGPLLHTPILGEGRDVSQTMNPFSGKSYRVLNFVVDMPVRIDTLSDGDTRPDRARTVFNWVEFQMVDEAQAEENEKGENNHALYKERQRMKVLNRLSRGLVIPKGMEMSPEMATWMGDMDEEEEESSAPSDHVNLDGYSYDD